MSCPDEATLTVWAEAPEEPEPGEGWTASAVADHVAGCPECREQAEGLRAALAAFRSVDLVDPDRYDEEWMEALAAEAEAQLDAPPTKILPLRPRRRLTPALAVITAVAAAVVLGLWLTAPTAPETEGESVASADPLEEEGRLLGRSLLDQALADDEGGVLAQALDADALLEEGIDEQWSFHTTIEDELDDLSTEELEALRMRL